MKISLSPLQALVNYTIGREANQIKLSLIQNVSTQHNTDWSKVISFHSNFPTEERLCPHWRKKKPSGGSGCLTFNQQLRGMPRDRTT